MPYEYLIVKFPYERRVLINNEDMGDTNTRLEIEGGQYIVTLDPPPDFTPKQYQIDLRNTSVMTPMVIEFKEV